MQLMRVEFDLASFVKQFYPKTPATNNVENIELISYSMITYVISSLSTNVERC